MTRTDAYRTTAEPETCHHWYCEAKARVKRLTLQKGDCLEVTRDWMGHDVDLIYMDPPFNTQRDFHEFEDIWGMETADAVGNIDVPDELRAYLAALRGTGAANTLAYLTYMAERLYRLYRLLKDDGSMYVHCDSHANGYLRVMLDFIFWPKNFRSEIIWRRNYAKSLAFKSYPDNHDTILYYTKSDKYVWNRPFRNYEGDYVERTYRHVEEGTGRRYTLASLLNINPDRENLHYEWNGFTRTWRWTKERMAEAERNNLIVYSKSGLAYQKLYLDKMNGIPIDTIWDDVKNLGGSDAERTGYPTQKPLKLLERIIQTSSNPGDLILDPFCGSGTTLVAAETLGRDWIGIDLSEKALQLAQQRLGQLGVQVEVTQ